MRKKILIYGLGLGVSLLLFSCSSAQQSGLAKDGKLSRQWLDSSSHKNAPPAWIDESRLVWRQQDKVWLRSVHTVRAAEGETRCFSLAQREAEETFLTEIASDIRSTLDSASLRLNPKAEAVLTKLRGGENEGRAPKLTVVENYFEKYRIGTEERIDCHLLNETAMKQFERFEAGILGLLEKYDEGFKAAVDKGRVKFFESKVKTGLKPLKGQ